MKTLTDSRNELLDYLQENGVSLEIIKKVSKELEKQDKEFIKEILGEIEKIKEVTAKDTGINKEDVLINPINVKEIIKNNSGFEK